ncbi:hypothetical protein FQA39_LY02284 [Lamprigera yunnana]|nr:hypothetical protein FQA39_LY02284 [Lamprigera yunnana]
MPKLAFHKNKIRWTKRDDTLWKMEFALLGVLLTISIAVASEDNWISKCNLCKCKWSDGKKTADCSNKYLNSIPTNLSDQIRYLDLSNNPLDLAMEHTLVTTPTTCAEPESLKGRLWSDLQSKDFACIPEILDQIVDKKLEIDAQTNYTLTCKVRGILYLTWTGLRMVE